MQLTAFLETAEETDAAFARRIGVSPQALSRYKLGQRRPEWDVLERIKDATSGAVTPNDFLSLPNDGAVLEEKNFPSSDRPTGFPRVAPSPQAATQKTGRAA